MLIFQEFEATAETVINEMLKDLPASSKKKKKNPRGGLIVDCSFINPSLTVCTARTSVDSEVCSIQTGVFSIASSRPSSCVYKLQAFYCWK